MEKACKLAMLQKAADLIGTQGVAARLQVPVILLRAWLAGHGTIPDLKLDVLADLIGPAAGKR